MPVKSVPLVLRGVWLRRLQNLPVDTPADTVFLLSSVHLEDGGGHQ